MGWPAYFDILYQTVTSPPFVTDSSSPDAPVLFSDLAPLRYEFRSVLPPINSDHISVEDIPRDEDPHPDAFDTRFVRLLPPHRLLPRPITLGDQPNPLPDVFTPDKFESVHRYLFKADRITIPPIETLGDIPRAEEVLIDKYDRPPDFILRRRPFPLADLLLPDQLLQGETENVTLDKWYSLLSEPVRRRGFTPPPVHELQITEFDESITLDKYEHVWRYEFRRGSTRIAAYMQFEGAGLLPIPDVAIPYEWDAQWRHEFRRLRLLPLPPLEYFTDEQRDEVTTPDKYDSPPTPPRRRPAFPIADLMLPDQLLQGEVETITLDKWYTPLSYNLFRQRLREFRNEFFQDLAADETITLDKWYTLLTQNYHRGRLPPLPIEAHVIQFPTLTPETFTFPDWQGVLQYLRSLPSRTYLIQPEQIVLFTGVKDCIETRSRPDGDCSFRGRPEAEYGTRARPDSSCEQRGRPPKCGDEK